MKKRGKIMMYSGIVAAVVSTAVGWQQLDLPHPALYTEVASVQQYAKSTRKIVLNQEWFRYKIQLAEARAQLAQTPVNRKLIEEVVRLELALRNVLEQLEKLK